MVAQRNLETPRTLVNGGQLANVGPTGKHLQSGHPREAGLRVV